MDHIPVHVGAKDLKQRLYEAVMPKWHAWAHDYPLLLDNLVMRDHHWVILLPKNPDCNIIAAQFFKSNKKGTLVFWTGKWGSLHSAMYSTQNPHGVRGLLGLRWDFLAVPVKKKKVLST